MLNKFNSRHNREAKSLYKMIQVPVPRLLRILESGEITTLSSFRRAAFPPFTVVVNGLATIVAAQSLQLGTVSANSAVFFDSDIYFLVVIFVATIVVLNFSGFPKWRFLPFLGSATSQFEFLKFQNARIS